VLSEMGAESNIWELKSEPRSAAWVMLLMISTPGQTREIF
jgi:hypothetical protein